MSAELTSASEHGRLSRETFAAAMAPFGLGAGARIAVAVSGGADSIALARLLAQWARDNGADLAAVTVDHRLRAEAAAEAAQVAAWLQPYCPHVTLAWEEGALESRERSPQKAARDARYRLMAGWCARENRSHLFLAHHADDQAETFLIRLTRGSGINGLASMAPVTRLRTTAGDVLLARPLLGHTKTDLADVCRNLGQPWLEDPSNENRASARIRFRQAAHLLEEEGFSRDRLLETVAHMQRARAALDQAAQQLLATATAWDQYGAVRVSLRAWAAAPEEIGLRALSGLLTAAGGQVYGPRFESLTRIATQMRNAHTQKGPWRDSTLHGCFIARDADCIVIQREAAQIDHVAAAAPGAPVLWDGRFRITLPAALAGGPFRIAAWTSAAPPEKLSDVPARLRASLPAVYDASGLAAVPHAGYLRADLARSGLEPADVACIPALAASFGVSAADETAPF